jgi:hypothetical protein
MALLADWHATAEFRHNQLGQVVDEMLSNKERKKKKKNLKLTKAPQKNKTKTTKEKKTKKVPKKNKKNKKSPKNNQKQTNKKQNKKKQLIFSVSFFFLPCNFLPSTLFSLNLRFHFLLFSQSGRLWGNHYGWKLLLNSKKVG